MSNEDATDVDTPTPLVLAIGYIQLDDDTEGPKGTDDGFKGVETDIELEG